MRRIRKGPWIYANICPDTEEYLSDYEYAYSNGLCPRCGHQDNSTFTHRRKVVYRKISVKHGWMFWKNFHFYVPKYDEDKELLNKLGYEALMDSELEQMMHR